MEVNIMSTKTENEIIEYRKIFGRPSFLGNTLEQNGNIRRYLIKAVGELHELGWIGRSDQDNLVLDVLEEILFPKSRQNPNYDGSRDCRIGIDVSIGERSKLTQVVDYILDDLL